MSQGSIQKQHWQWTPVNDIIRCSSANQVFEHSLEPTVQLCSEDKNTKVSLSIDTERNFQYSPDLGWNWHKSWNLPNISINLRVREEDTEDDLLLPLNTYVRIMAIKQAQPNSEEVMCEVGLKGKTCIELIDGRAFFSGIKFKSTTYNNDGSKFHLLLCIFVQDDNDSRPRVILATRSPSIFVDSRKSARDERRVLQQIQPFDPESLEKLFQKKEIQDEEEMEIIIQNNDQGLFHYLSAPNIRNKIKHPVFLALKFSNCLLLLQDTEQTNVPGTNDLLQLQTHLFLSREKINKKKSKYALLLRNCSSNKLKSKIVDMLSQIFSNNQLMIIAEPKKLSPSYEQIQDLQHKYIKNYEILLDSYKNMQQKPQLNRAQQENIVSTKSSTDFERCFQSELVKESEVENQIKKKVKLEENDHPTTKHSTPLQNKKLGPLIPLTPVLNQTLPPLIRPQPTLIRPQPIFYNQDQQLQQHQLLFQLQLLQRLNNFQQMQQLLYLQQQ